MSEDKKQAPAHAGSSRSIHALSGPALNSPKMVAHDLNNLLCIMRGNADLIYLAASESEKVRKWAQAIVAAEQRAEKLTARLLDSTVQNNPEPGLKLGLINLDELIEQAALLVRHSPTAHHLVIDMACDLPLVVGDGELLRRCAENLFANALKYTPLASQIHVECVLEKEFILLRFSDEGPGIPRSNRETVFQPGTRLRQYRHIQANTSRGLGLPFCRQVIESHGGRIWIEDNKPTGAVFCIQLPIAGPPTLVWIG